MTAQPKVGELFILGFRGRELPAWLREFESEFGLGGAILFDYDCQKRAYDNNIHSPEQVRALCSELTALPSRPLVTVDQEGGKVRRLKEKLGFAPLPSAKAFNGLPDSERESITRRSFSEMRALGFDYDLTPVIDLDSNPENPDIGKVERSYSPKAADVRACAEVVDRIARETGLGLCLKHFPGLGGATVNSHEQLTDISGSFSEEQLQLFYELANSIHGGAVLVSHGIVREWDPKYPVSMSPVGIGKLRERAPEALLISDDLQMQGLQKLLPSAEACVQGIRAGLDMVILGNNLITDDDRCLDYAHALATESKKDPEFAKRLEESIRRVASRKTLFKVTRGMLRGLAIAFLGACAVSRAWAAPEIPFVIEGKTLGDSVPVRVDARDGKSAATVVIFISARCPCSISHENGLKSLAAEFKSIRFIGVHSNSDEPAGEAASHFSALKLPFPVIQDDGAKLADAFGALKTPHAFVLAKDGTVLYQGGVDDSHDAPEAKVHYLENALKAIQTGKNPEPTRTRSLGCVIKRS
jgi:beta-N-acetylhexosaminidase